MINTLLFVVLVALQIGDIYTTYVVLTKQNGVEINPIVRKVMSTMGILPGLLTMKSALLLFVYFMPPNAQIIVLWFGVVLYAVVVFNNFTVMRK